MGIYNIYTQSYTTHTRTQVFISVHVSESASVSAFLCESRSFTIYISLSLALSHHLCIPLVCFLTLFRRSLLWDFFRSIGVYGCLSLVIL